MLDQRPASADIIARKHSAVSGGALISVAQFLVVLNMLPQENRGSFCYFREKHVQLDYLFCEKEKV